jgi:hypothetical protein
MAQRSPEAIVQENLDAYNKRDIEAFMQSFSDSIVVTNYADKSVIAKGLVQVRAVYQSLFDASPQLHSTILKRIVFDNKVIDHESIVGRRGVTTPIELIAIYEVKLDKIVAMTFIRKQ